MSISVDANTVIRILAAKDGKILNFKQISSYSELPRERVKRACHELRRIGYAEYFTGGSVGGGFKGSGYMVMPEGSKYVTG
ncbi:hypothetical protein [Leisingera aquaemixtae]|uniref:Transcriptional regulator n=1 Tax=Leisingera aquaemixtae TaxID=1396826 RepID=A0A0P1HCB6_9RHOB|nr:hypothetical protein [Leisingera aquaemixtae]CUI01112.1 hypothetical protein PHA8399_03253 [Leisingera aquaemixtae]